MATHVSAATEPRRSDAAWLDVHAWRAHPSVVIQSVRRLLRCLFVTTVALALVTARPAMLLSHAGDASPHRCGATMPSHQGSHSTHHCSTDAASCCDACLGACAMAAALVTPPLTAAVIPARTAVAAAWPPAMVRERQSPSLRLPPPIGPPVLTRS
jgi:hypothetical protein